MAYCRFTLILPKFLRDIARCIFFDANALGLAGRPKFRRAFNRIDSPAKMCENTPAPVGPGEPAAVLTSNRVIRHSFIQNVRGRSRKTRVSRKSCCVFDVVSSARPVTRTRAKSIDSDLTYVAQRHKSVDSRLAGKSYVMRTAGLTPLSVVHIKTTAMPNYAAYGVFGPVILTVSYIIPEISSDSFSMYPRSSLVSPGLLLFFSVQIARILVQCNACRV